MIGPGTGLTGSEWVQLYPNATYLSQIPKKTGHVDKNQRKKARCEGGFFRLFSM
jgi:hypothetical protein